MHELGVATGAILLTHHRLRLFKPGVIVVEQVINFLVCCNSNIPFWVLSAFFQRSHLGLFVFERASERTSVWIAIRSEVVRRGCLCATTLHLCASLVAGHLLDLRDRNVVEVLHDTLMLLNDMLLFRLLLADDLFVVWTGISGRLGLSWLSWL